MNKLFYGDNLDILRGYIKDETVDLIYLDPPFNSNATYGGEVSRAMTKIFRRLTASLKNSIC